MRVTLFGGTFDPIHRGHLAIAGAAANGFGLDRVVFAPTGRQPLKVQPPEASFEDRLEMVRVACSAPGADARFAVSEMDAPRADGRPNFTVDLLRRMVRSEPGAQMFLLTGADSFLTLRRWKEPEELLRLCEWIVVSRPGSPVPEEEVLALGLNAAERARVHVLATMHEEVSATELRRLLAAGDRCAEWIPEGVWDYMARHGLYTGGGGGGVRFGFGAV